MRPITNIKGKLKMTEGNNSSDFCALNEYLIKRRQDNETNNKCQMKITKYILKKIMRDRQVSW
jgi:hypothetical protein